MKAKRTGTPATPGLAEELLYECLLSAPREGEPMGALMALRNGGLMAGFWYSGPDLEASSEDGIARLCASVHGALEALGHAGGWMLHFECMRHRAHSHLAAAKTACATDRLCDEERAEAAVYYETHHALFLTYLDARDELGIAGRVERFARGKIGVGELLGGQGAHDAATVSTHQLEGVLAFERRLEHVERVLRGAGVSISRMRTSEDNCELLQALNYALNGAWHPLRPPPVGTHVDILLARDLHVEVDDRGVTSRHGDRVYQIVEPVRFPQESWAGMLQTLEQLGVEWRRSTRAILVGTSESITQLEDKEKKWDGLRAKLKDVGKLIQRPRRSAVEAADEVGDALRDLETGARFGVHVTNVVVVVGDTTAAAREAAREVERAFQLSGFAAFTQTKGNRQALLGSFPGHGYQNVHRPFLDSLNLVHMLSLSTEWGGEETIPSKLYPAGSPPLLQASARSKARFFVNLHQAPRVGAVAESRSEDTAHAAVFGPVGAGKSALANALVSQFLGRYASGRVIVLDNGYSAYKLARSRGHLGAHYVLGAEGAQINPFARVHEPRWMAFANDFIAGLAARQKTQFGEAERLCVAEALQRLKHGRRAEDRSLRRLWMDINEPRHIKDLLEHYVLGGARGVIDGERDDLSRAKLTVFELGELLNRDETVTQAGLHYVLELIRTMPDGSPTLVVVDEAGLALRDATIARSIQELILRGRKENVHVLLLFHSARQLLDTPLASTVLPNVRTRFWLPNPEAGNESEHEGYREVGLSREVLALIATARRKHEYVYQSGSYTRVFSLEMGPVQRAFWTYDGRADLDFVRQLERELGDWWPREYLARHGLTEAAERWEKLQSIAKRRSKEVA